MRAARPLPPEPPLPATPIETPLTAVGGGASAPAGAGARLTRTCRKHGLKKIYTQLPTLRMAWLQQMNPTRNARRSAARARHCPGTAPANAEALGGPRSPRDDLREIPRDRPRPGTVAGGPRSSRDARDPGGRRAAPARVRDGALTWRRRRPGRGGASPSNVSSIALAGAEVQKLELPRVKVTLASRTTAARKSTRGTATTTGTRRGDAGSVTRASSSTTSPPSPTPCPRSSKLRGGAPARGPRRGRRGGPGMEGLAFAKDRAATSSKNHQAWALPTLDDPASEMNRNRSRPL